MPRDEKTFEMESQGSAAKSALQPAGLDSALPEFRNARLDGSGGGADGGRVNLGAHFVDWCTRHDVLPRKVVDGELRPLEGPDFTRIIEANASMSPAGDPIPEHGSAAVQLGPAVTDLESKASAVAALTAFYPLPDFTGWRVSKFVQWCVVRGLVPRVKATPSSPPLPPKSGQMPLMITGNDPTCCAPGVKKEDGEHVNAIL